MRPWLATGPGSCLGFLPVGTKGRRVARRVNERVWGAKGTLAMLGNSVIDADGRKWQS